MKNTSKNKISAATKEAMGLNENYPMSNGQSDFDASGQGSSIPAPIDMHAASMAAAQVPTTAHAADIATAAPVAASPATEGEPTEEDNKKKKAMPIETTEEVKIKFHDALMALLGEDVDATLVNQLEAVFEAAVEDRVAAQVAEISEGIDANVKVYLDNVTEALTEKVDDYLDFVVEDWMKTNALQVEMGVKTQIAENFISGLKELFESNYIDIPDEKYNVVDDLYAKNRELEARLNESLNGQIELRKQVDIAECAGIFVNETRDLADTQVEKLQNLMESVTWETPEEYRDKVKAIKENYVSHRRPVAAKEHVPVEDFSKVQAPASNLMEGYAQAMGRLNRKVN